MTDHIRDATKKVLSPAAKAVLDAYYNAAKAVLDICGDFEIGSARNKGIAATLRALVLKCEYCDDYGASFIDPKEILAIATELEGQ